MSPKLYYFQAPNFDINPASDTAPKLGTILPNLDRLTGSLNQANVVEIPANLQNQSTTTDFEDTVYANYGGSTGLSLNVLQGIFGSASVAYGLTTGLSSSISKELKNSPEIEVQFDGTTIGAPVGAGPKLNLEIATGRNFSPGKSENQVVFAYQVIKIKRKRDGELNYKHKHGGLYSVEEDSDTSHEGEEVWDVEQLDEELMIKDFPQRLRD
ncbi:hypothetical protein N7488_005083 [Penicillium malachiteum]|nr:hypothetical protein N7488_005083 [Penicillium malachiteum]